jgi:glycerate kinase
VLVVTHSGDLVRALRSAGATTIELTKGGGATSVDGAGMLDGPAWTWPRR